MKTNIELFIESFTDIGKRKRFLKCCFNADIKAKLSRHFPKTFLIINRRFTQNEVFYASKIYLDIFASLEDKKLYYNATNDYIIFLKNKNNQLYLKCRETFKIFLEDGLYSLNFKNLIKKYNCDIEELLQYIIRYSTHYATEEERYEFNKYIKKDFIFKIKIKYYRIKNS